MGRGNRSVLGTDVVDPAEDGGLAVEVGIALNSSRE